MESPGGRRPAGPSSRPALLAAQLAVLLVIGAALAAAAPGASTLRGLAGGFLAWLLVVASAAGRAAWRRSSRLRPHWSRHGGEIVTREVVRTGVGLVVVLFTVAPLTLWAGVLPVWLLAAVTVGVAAALPVGVAVELRALNPDVEGTDRRRRWGAAVAAVAVSALGLVLLAVLAGLVRGARGLAWAVAALAALALTAWVRDRWPDRASE